MVIGRVTKPLTCTACNNKGFRQRLKPAKVLSKGAKVGYTTKFGGKSVKALRRIDSFTV